MALGPLFRFWSKLWCLILKNRQSKLQRITSLKHFAYLSERAYQRGPSSLSWIDRSAPCLLASRYLGRWCHWESAQSSLQVRQVLQERGFPVLACAVSNCSVRFCCTRARTSMQSCTWTCNGMGCSVSCCTVSGCTVSCCTVSECTVLECTWLPRRTWMCIALACKVRGCSRSACGMLACTVRCVCTLTQVHCSCTSSLQRFLRPGLPPLPSAQEEAREKSKRMYWSNK